MCHIKQKLPVYYNTPSYFEIKKKLLTLSRIKRGVKIKQTINKEQ